ncbi:MAG TPA: tRNA-uridine aminocarboxypropyltransferase [Candidatus Binatia bacterium]
MRSTGLRQPCPHCRRPPQTCYCAHVRPFASDPRFIILIHPNEARHPFGTGRMAHLCLANSLLIEGIDFSAHHELQSILDDPANFPVLLYPGTSSVNVSQLPPDARLSFVPRGKKLVIIVPDGTWRTSRKMIHRSQNLRDLPRVSIDAPAHSNYRIRKQPRPGLYCTVEAIQRVITLLAPATDGGDESHRNLLQVFNFAVERQLNYTPAVRGV